MKRNGFRLHLRCELSLPRPSAWRCIRFTDPSILVTDYTRGRGSLSSRIKTFGPPPQQLNLHQQLHQVPVDQHPYAIDKLRHPCADNYSAILTGPARYCSSGRASLWLWVLSLCAGTLVFASYVPFLHTWLPPFHLLCYTPSVRSHRSWIISRHWPFFFFWSCSCWLRFVLRPEETCRPRTQQAKDHPSTSTRPLATSRPPPPDPILAPRPRLGESRPPTMPRRRYRLFTLCAAVIIFLLYRTLQTSWAQSADSYDSLHSPPKSPVQPLAGGGDDSTDLSGHASPPLLADEQDAAEKHLYGDSKAKDTEVKVTEVKVTEVKDTPEYDSSSDSASDDGSSTPPSKPAVKDEEPVKEAVPEVPKVHWTDPPVDNHNMEHPAEDAEELAQHWIRPKENFPLPSASLIPIPTGTPKQIPKVQYDFDPESDQAKATRLKRQARVKVELERAWSGYREYAWMHDELSPLSNGYRDPFCGWAATLVDSLDTLWIADMRDEFDEAATAVAKIDFTFTPKNDIPVFETTIRYLGGLLAAYDVSGGAEGKYPILLQKATELAEILMGMFDTPNRMPILYYVWRPPYSSEPHRAGSVGIAELATLSLEFTRLAQLTGAAKYYDAIDRITDALVLMQAEGHTHIPGLFPERIDASGCNKTATTLRDTLSKEAQKQIDSDELDVPPKGFQTELKAKSESEPEMKLNARAVIPPPNPDAEKSEEKSEESSSDNSLGPVYAPSSNEEGEGETKNIGRAGPHSADGSTSKWDCVPQGLMPASYGGAQYHMGGAQDSAYEYFPKVSHDTLLFSNATDHYSNTSCWVA